MFSAMGLKVFSADNTTEVSIHSLHKHAHYLSINGTFFLQQFFSFSNNTASISPSPYIVQYRYQPGPHGFRIDAGSNLSNKKNFLDSSQVQINRTAAFNFRIGYAYQKKIAGHWTVFTGCDVITSINPDVFIDNSTIDIVTTTNNPYTIGLGPALGIQFAISDRVGSFNETAFHYQSIFSEQTSSSVNFPETDTTTSGIENDLKFIIPVPCFSM